MLGFFLNSFCVFEQQQLLKYLKMDLTILVAGLRYYIVDCEKSLYFFNFYTFDEFCSMSKLLLLLNDSTMIVKAKQQRDKRDKELAALARLNNVYGFLLNDPAKVVLLFM